jgi:uncharacterized protein
MQAIDHHHHHSDSDMFIIPVLGQFLLYAPLHNLAALVDLAAARQLKRQLASRDWDRRGPLGEIAGTLAGKAEPTPLPRRGDFTPSFLGLLPTRRCNLGCRYCGFVTGADGERVMSLDLARDAVNWYMDAVGRAGVQEAEVHFFGGEPFCAAEVLDLAVYLARRRAAEMGCTVAFEVATNGVFDEARARWAADNLDTVVLSFDGPPDIQDRHRPHRGGQPSFEEVARTARVLSAGGSDLCIRACVTDETVQRMPDLADWFCEHFHPGSVCFEPLQPSPESRAAGLQPPDPWDFAGQFIQAASILESHGVLPVYAAADIRTKRATFCPVGRDAAIVSPDGTISACYLLQQDWEAKGLDLRLGRMEAATAQLDLDAVASVRRLNVHNKPVCAGCFCKYHCAGGCHVNHGPQGPQAGYDRLCIQTRIITLRNILVAMGQDELVGEWMGQREAAEAAIGQPSDLLLDLGEGA